MKQENNILSISKQTLQRLPYYLNYLHTQHKNGVASTSATLIAKALNLNNVLVRKDLALVSDGGRPKTGYVITGLIEDIEQFLGYDNVTEAVIVGAGHLGKALMSYGGFESYGLEIIAAFDADPSVIGLCINGKTVFDMDKMKNLCQRLNIHIGIITVGEEHAQQVCDTMVESGILAIWNFAPVHLNVPDRVIVQNENMASSLAVLSKHLEQRLEKPSE